jgi:hypothetical protein
MKIYMQWKFYVPWLNLSRGSTYIHYLKIQLDSW